MSLPKRDGVQGRYYLIQKPDTNPEVLEHADQCIQDVLDGTAKENHSGYPVVVRNQSGTPFLPSQLLGRYLSKLPLKGYNIYKRLVYHTAYKIMGDSYLAEDVLQEVFLYVAKNFSKIHRENCHELAAYLVSCSRSRAYDMLRKQREEPLEEVPDAPDDAPVPDDAAVSTDNIQYLTELIGQMKPMYRDPLRLLAMGYTNREIAESLGLTDEVVRMRLFRGRKLLWKELNSRE